ncbi:hypothetical protein N7523_000122 [Penicillium sp. IBT 18751x]|nr:hypothetical protein N7523_000122 [Penicillium sp. IBT 18751x]
MWLSAYYNLLKTLRMAADAVGGLGKGNRVVSRCQHTLGKIMESCCSIVTQLELQQYSGHSLDIDDVLERPNPASSPEEQSIEKLD